MESSEEIAMDSQTRIPLFGKMPVREGLVLLIEPFGRLCSDVGVDRCPSRTFFGIQTNESRMAIDRGCRLDVAELPLFHVPTLHVANFLPYG